MKAYILASFCLLIGINQSIAQDIPARVTALEQSDETFKKEMAALKAEMVALTNTVNTLAQENEALKEQAAPVGSIQAYAGDKIPDGWKFCDGAELDQSAYPKLFNAIGKAWGGSGTKFRLPDLRGRFLRGVSGTNNADPDKDSRTSLYSGGNKGNQHGTYQDDATSLPSEQFTGQTNTAGEHKHNINGSALPEDTQINWTMDDSRVKGTKYDKYATNPAGNHSHSVTINSGGDSETRPANAYVYFIIRYE